MKSFQHGLYGAVCVLVVFAFAGCGGGEKLVTITGKLVDGGQPIDFTKFEGVDAEEIEELGMAPVEIDFWPVDEAGNIDPQRKPQSASVELDGSFEASGLEGEGIPAGRYRIALRYTPAEDIEDEAERAKATPWGDKFGKENSPWVYDFTSDQEITLDISQAGGGSE